MRRRVSLLIIAGAMVMVLLPHLSAESAYAATFTVNTTRDEQDTVLGDSICRTLSNTCSLRAAVQEANALTGDDTIDLPAGVFELSRVGIDDNAANGDLDLKDRVTIRGADVQTTTVTWASNVTNRDRIFDLRPDARATIERMTIRGGDASNLSGGGATGGTGGGIRVDQGARLTLRVVLVRENRAVGGGGIHVRRNGSVSIFRSAVELNDAPDGDGGGILADNGSVSLEQTSILENRARRGGGIFVQGGVLDTRNVTISLNTASRQGGGIGADLGGSRSDTSLFATTIAYNKSAPGLGGNIWDNSLPGSPFLFVGSSIISNGNIDNCAGRPLTDSLAPNLESANSCGFTMAGSLVNTNPSLVALLFFSMPLRMHALPSTSPAVDATNICLMQVDQRGVARPQDGNRDGSARCDMGAYEVVPR